MKPKYFENAKLCYINTDSFLVHVKTDDIYKDIAKDVENKIATSIYKIGRPLPIRKNKNGVGLMKDESGGQVIKTFVGLKAKTYSYLKDNNDEDKQKAQKGVSYKENLI